MTNPHNRVLIGTVKDEGPFLLEWLCYYALIGFDHMVIASNDCRDGTDEMLGYLDRIGQITHIPNDHAADGEPADPQNRAYQRAWALPEIRRATWVLVADADEFLNIHAGDGTLDALFAAMRIAAGGPVDLIAAPWRVFGNAGLTGFVDAPVIGQFTCAASPGVHAVQRYTAFKTLARARVIKALGVHRPRLAPRFRLGQKPLCWVNGSGQPLPQRYLTQGWRLMRDSYGAGLVSMNHYMIKSTEAFLMKRYRGTANSADQSRIDFDYFDLFNVNTTAETRIQQHLPALTARIAALKAQHPQLAKLHDESCAWHRARLARAKQRLWQDDPVRAQALGLKAGGPSDGQGA